MCLLYEVSWRVGCVECCTAAEGFVCVFGVKCGDLCGSEGVVAQGADWHSGAGY